MARAGILKIGQGFGTWLIPIIIFGALASIVVLSLITLVFVYSRRPRTRITDQEPEMTYETYRTPTIPYKNPSSNSPADPTIGRLIAHSRSLHVVSPLTCVWGPWSSDLSQPRNQLINGRRLRPQVSSPELRNTSRPPPYMFRAMAPPSPQRNTRPHGQVYFDHILDPGHPYHIPQQPQQLTSPPEDLPAQLERHFSVSSPSSYSSTCLSSDGPASVGAFSPPSTPSIFSQESFALVRTRSWVDSPEPRRSVSYPDNLGPLLAASSHNDLSAVSVAPGSYEAEKRPTPRPRRRSETGGRNNRRLIIVDNNLVGEDSEPSPEAEAYNLRRIGISRLVRGTLERRAGAGVSANSTPNKDERVTAKEVQIEKPPPVGHTKERNAVFKVICPDTGDLWKMLVIPGETLDGFAGRVKQKMGGDVNLFVDDEVLASEEDWEAAKGGGRIVARLIR